MTLNLIRVPSSVDWLKVSAITALVAAAVFALALTQCRKPQVDPALGKALAAKTQAQASTAQKTIEQGSAALEPRVMEPIQARAERTKPHVAKIRAAAAASPRPAVGFPDDEFYRGVCGEGGIYARHPEHSGPCREPAGGSGTPR